MKSISSNCLSLIKILQVSDSNVEMELAYMRNFNRWKNFMDLDSWFSWVILCLLGQRDQLYGRVAVASVM